MSETNAFVITALAEYAEGSDTLVSPLTLLDALQLDSIAILEFSLQIEERFSVELDPALFSTCVSIADVIALVNKARQG
jgi:acyl carrier protein